MISVIVGVFFGVAVGIFIAAIFSAGKYHDLVVENRVLTNKLVEIYRIKDHQDDYARTNKTT